MLSIVPVKIKSKMSDKYIETYDFLDPGCKATFCTEDPQRKLNVKGKPTRILLSTMSRDKPGEQKFINFTYTLVGVLLRFRQEPIALMADIKSMFYQANLPDRDADLLHFLWWANGKLDEPIKEYRMTVHLFGAKSSSSVASYALRGTAEDHKDKVSLKAVQTVLYHFYVDNCLKSVAS